MRSRITDVPAALIEAHSAEATKRTGKAGQKDAPYVAAVLAVDGVLWTHDATLAKECPVPVVSTKQLIDAADS